MLGVSEEWIADGYTPHSDDSQISELAAELGLELA